MQNTLDKQIDNYDWRPVGGGIKIQYNGAVQSRAGTYYLFEQPNNANWLVAQATDPQPTDLLKFEECAYTIIDENAVSVVHHPRDPTDTSYASNYYFQGDGAYSNFSNLATYHTMGILVTGAPTGGSFTFDCVMHWEMVGTAVPSRTMSHADVLGMQKITQTFPIQTPLSDPKVNLAKAMTRVGYGTSGYGGSSQYYH